MCHKFLSIILLEGVFFLESQALDKFSIATLYSPKVCISIISQINLFKSSGWSVGTRWKAKRENTPCPFYVGPDPEIKLTPEIPESTDSDPQCLNNFSWASLLLPVSHRYLFLPRYACCLQQWQVLFMVISKLYSLHINFRKWLTFISCTKIGKSSLKNMS